MSAPVDPYELLTLPEVSQIMRRSRRSLERDIAAGRLRVVHLGGSTRVPRMYLDEYVYGDPATVPTDNISAPATRQRPGADTGDGPSHAEPTFTHEAPR